MVPRHLRLLAVAAGVGGVLLASAGPASADTPRLASATSFRNSVGVATHPTYFNTAYGQWDRVIAILRDLGVRHIRSGIYASANDGWNTRLYSTLTNTVNAGIGLDLVANRDCAYDGNVDRCLSAIRTRLPVAGIDAVEWPNEYDLSGDPKWPTNLATWGHALYTKLKADAALKGIPVIGPSLARPTSFTTLGDQSAYLNRGGIHPYTGATSPNPTHIATEVARETPVAATKPVSATEAGFHTSLSFTNVDQPAADEQTAAVYTLRTVLEHFADGIDRTYIYELLNSGTDPLNSQANYGMVRADFTPKPAYTALRNLLAMTGVGAPATLTPLSLPVTTGATDLRSLLLQQSDDTYELVLWRTASVWDRVAKLPIAVTPVPVSVAVPAGAVVARGLPLSGPGLTSATVTGGSVTQSIGAEPVVLRITTAPADTVAAADDTWSDDGDPAAIHGGDAFLDVSQGAPQKTARMAFDLGAQAPATVKLRVYATGGAFASYSVWRTGTAWSEGMSGAELAAAAPPSGWTRVASGITFTGPGFRDVTLDASAFGAGRQSLVLQADNGGGQLLRLVSTENGYGGALGPRLVVTR